MISKTAKEIKESITLSISTKAKEMKRKGKDVISLSAGEPAEEPAEEIKKAGINAIKENFTRYTPTAGIPELRKTISEKFLKENKLKYKPKQIIVTNGGKQALINAILAITNKGDEIIIPKPYWVSYTEQVKLARGKPIIAETKNFAIKEKLIREKITSKTKAIIINSPNNPTGKIIENEELEKIAKLAIEKNIWVISDEVYEYFTYEGKHTSIGSLNKEILKKTITINAVSKSHSMTGLRIGYAGGPEEIIKAMTKIQGHTTSGACSIAQKMALAAIPLGANKKRIEKFKEKRDFVVNKLNAMGLQCEKPEGAFYAFPKIKGKSEEFCKKLLEEKYVATIPGKGFGQEGNIRISFVEKKEKLEEGLKRIAEFCKR